MYSSEYILLAQKVGAHILKIQNPEPYEWI